MKNRHNKIFKLGLKVQNQEMCALYSVKNNSNFLKEELIKIISLKIPQEYLN